VVNQSNAQQTKTRFSVFFYNVENLFDTKNDTQTEDDNFTPEGDLHWTNKRLTRKLNQISKVILSSSGWNSPDIIALAEIENRTVLEKLINDTPLNNFPYRIIHKESPDHRGIDTGVLYNSESFYPIEYQYYPLILNQDTIQTREILYLTGVVNNTDTLHLFCNHWPSRFSGLLETKSLRIASARLLKNKVNEISKKYSSPKIVIVGDFNDNPEDESIAIELEAGKVEQPVTDHQLYNLFYENSRAVSGSLKYQSQWYLFDQVIVSGSLLNARSGLAVGSESAQIVSQPFLFEKDQKYGGYKPFRTYSGFTYNGGFSDHLPVLLELKIVD
jgi:predicted extracellular nuclease